MKHSITLAAVLFAAAIVFGQHDHRAAVDHRGDRAMGFSHEKTTHHFRLLHDGGSIEVEANDGKDTASRDQIREHLDHITMLFAAGDFDVPMFIHDRTPPGSVTMQRLREHIKYQFEKTERGGRVRIITRNTEALRAVHDFLRFQIEDHRTGDSTSSPSDVSHTKIQ